MRSENLSQLRRRAKLIAMAAILPFACVLPACTGDKSGALSETKSAVSGIAKVAQTPATNVTCASEELQAFERQDGEVLDLERENLPRGLFLAKASELLIEKKSESSFARAIVREVIGGKGAEIACAEGIENLGPDFDMAISGLVKFDTTERPQGSDFVSRQFFFYQDRTGYGVVLSNPRLASQSVDLKRQIRSGSAMAQLVRLSPRGYLLKYQRERDGVRARLFVHLELIP